MASSVAPCTTLGGATCGTTIARVRATSSMITVATAWPWIEAQIGNGACDNHAGPSPCLRCENLRAH